MNTTKRQNPLAGTLLVVVVAAGGLAVAQAIGKMSPAPQLESSPALSAVQRQMSNVSASRQRIVDWFTAYDDLRHQAQMSPSERSTAHRLMDLAFIADGNDKEQVKTVLARMIKRYTIAGSQLRRLPPIAETAQLQQEYQDYFSTGREFFSKYLQALNDNDKSPNLRDSLNDGRRQLWFMDISHKMLDYKLREQYNIAPYRW